MCDPLLASLPPFQGDIFRLKATRTLPAIAVSRQLAAQAYKPQTAYLTSTQLTHLESVAFSSKFRADLQRFARGIVYYRTLPGLRLISTALNPQTREPFPLRHFATFFETLVCGLAGCEFTASAHIERIMSLFKAMQDARKRRVGDSRISVELRSPSHKSDLEVLGTDGWMELHPLCLPLRRTLLGGYFRGNAASAYVRKMHKRLAKQRKRPREIDYQVGDFMGSFLFERGRTAGRTAAGHKRQGKRTAGADGGRKKARPRSRNVESGEDSSDNESSDESSDDESSDDESSDLGSGEQKGASGMYECPLCDDTVEGINRCDSCDTLYCARHLPWNISRCSLCLEADDDDNVGNDGSDSDSAEKGEGGGRNSAEKGDGDGDSVAGGAAAASEEVVVSEVEDDECCEICNM